MIRHALSRLCILLFIAALLISAVPIQHSHAQKSTPTAFTSLAAIVFPGVKTPPAQYGVYLGSGIVLTNWHPWTQDGREYTATQPTTSPGAQIHTFDADGVIDPGEHLIESAFIQGAGFIFPGVGDNLDSTPVPIERLIYASREYDIALFAVNPLSVETRGVQAAQLTLMPTGAEQRVQVPGNDPGAGLIAVNTTLLTGSPRLLPDVPYALSGPWRVPSLAIAALNMLAEGGPVFDTATGHLLGLTWRSAMVDDAAQLWITPAALWIHALYAANDEIADPALAAMLDHAATAPLNAPAALGDPVAPALGNAGIDVQHYDLNLTLDPAAATLTGTATLTIRATYDHLSTFSLDARAFAVARVMVNHADVPFVAKEEKLVIELPEPVAYGTAFTVDIDYSAGPLPFRSEFIPFFDIGMFFDGGTVSTLNEPDGAHSWFPCNDHPSDRATYDITLRVPEPLVAVSNGDLLNTTPYDDGTRAFHWRMKYPMATYLVVAAVADYTAIDSTTSGGITITHYVYADQAEAGAQVFGYTGDAILLLQDIFGPYPFDGYGHVVVPEKGMALETQAMTTMPDSLLLGSELEAFDLLIHELAHQWFGNTVTPATWADIWLNEGFATWAEWLGAELRFGDSAAIAARSASEQALMSDHRTSPLAAPATAELFGLATYKKGGWVLHMLRREIGDEAFFTLLRTYVDVYRNRPVDTIGFWQLAEQVSGRDLDPFFRQWLMQGDMPRYTLYWTETPAGADVLLCPTTPSNYTLDLTLRFVNDTSTSDVILAVDGTWANMSTDLGFAPRLVTVDPGQDVLAQVQVQPIAALPAMCPPPVYGQ